MSDQEKTTMQENELPEKPKRGRPKAIKKPAKLWEYFTQYRNEIHANPFMIVEQRKAPVIIPKEARGSVVIDDTVELPKRRPLTMEGFENWLEDHGIINDIGDYMSNKGESYTDFSTICTRIKREIRQDQIEGGMAGLYNPSITQRLTGLQEKVGLSGPDGGPIEHAMDVTLHL